MYYRSQIRIIKVYRIESHLPSNSIKPNSNFGDQIIIFEKYYYRN